MNFQHLHTYDAAFVFGRDMDTVVDYHNNIDAAVVAHDGPSVDFLQHSIDLEQTISAMLGFVVGAAVTEKKIFSSFKLIWINLL